MVCLDTGVRTLYSTCIIKITFNSFVLLSPRFSIKFYKILQRAKLPFITIIMKNFSFCPADFPEGLSQKPAEPSIFY